MNRIQNQRFPNWDSTNDLTKPLEWGTLYKTSLEKMEHTRQLGLVVWTDSFHPHCSFRCKSWIPLEQVSLQFPTSDDSRPKN
jgi:hypothetical protein